MVGAGPTVALGWRRRTTALAVLAAVLMTLLTPGLAGASQPKVHQLRIDGVINVFSADYITGGIASAEAEGANAVLITMDTPGGIDTSMRRIIQAILGSRLPVIVYVSPSGARAASAGLFITQSADVIAMAPGTNIGSAHPVLIGGSSSTDPTQQIEDQKVLNDSVAYIQSLANLHHRNADWAADAVRNSANVTADQAVSLHVADTVSNSVDELLHQVDGRQVVKNGQTITIHTAGAAINDDTMSVPSSLLHLLADPSIALVLLLLAVLAIGVEVLHPGAVVPGVVGVLCGILALVALESLPVNYAGVALVLFSVVLFAIDVRAPTHGVLTFGGVVSLAVGSFLVLDATGPYLLPNLALAVVPAVGVGLILAFFVSRAIAARRRPVTTGTQRLVGLLGEVREDVGAEPGMVMVDGALWRATASVPITRGSMIRVTGMRGLTLDVEPVVVGGETPSEPQAAAH
jgi:membrane-bound serine protease (ClpP class)